MTETNSIPPVPQARRKHIVLNPNISRVITRPYIPHTEERIRNIIYRVLSLSEDEACALLETIIYNQSHRHRYFREALKKNFSRVASHVPDSSKPTEQRQLLIGAYFTAEYSVEAAALFNPSIVQVPGLQTDAEGSSRFIMSFRAVGEGHISSIEFRSGIIDKNNDIYFDPLSNYVRTPRINPVSSYNRDLFWLKLEDIGVNNEALHWLLDNLSDKFTFNELQIKIEDHSSGNNALTLAKKEVIEKAMYLARSNYEIVFQSDHQISERVLFPRSESERSGIEDARFVRFVDDDGTVIYYATYTAYDGKTTLPQMIKTKDFLSFKINTLNGQQANGKGMALFPRKINGKYVMLSRQDGENNSIMFSDNVHFWHHSHVLQTPMFPHEFFQIGNGGSPIETPDGWLVITHCVGPVRTYSLGIMLLDLDDPTRVISRIDKPILVPNEYDRDGYVPNVVYTCGVMIFQNELIIPFASADQRCGIATLNLAELMARLRYNKVLNGN